MIDNKLDIYAERRVRRGKSAKDAKRGAKQRADANLAERNAWHKDPKKTGAMFPAQLLKGNGNSSTRRPERKPGKRAK